MAVVQLARAGVGSRQLSTACSATTTAGFNSKPPIILGHPSHQHPGGFAASVTGSPPGSPCSSSAQSVRTTLGWSYLKAWLSGQPPFRPFRVATPSKSRFTFFATGTAKGFGLLHTRRHSEYDSLLSAARPSFASYSSPSHQAAEDLAPCGASLVFVPGKIQLPDLYPSALRFVVSSLGFHGYSRCRMELRGW
jgi:hypothetical protein